jgi:hypothetical protein
MADPEEVEDLRQLDGKGAPGSARSWPTPTTEDD